MKTFKLISSIFIFSLLIMSCNDDRVFGSGNVVTENQDFSDITKIDISDAFHAFVQFSDTEEKVEIEADDNLFDFIIVEKIGDELKVGLKSFTHIKGDPTLNVYITTKTINNFEASGAAHIELEETLIAEDVSVDLSGASDFSGPVDITRLTLKATGASHSNIEGRVEFFNLNNSGASQLEDYDLEVEDLEVRLSGASSARLTVNNTIDATLSGASQLKYKGNAIIENQNLSGASEIRKMD